MNESAFYFTCSNIGCPCYIVKDDDDGVIHFGAEDIPCHKPTDRGLTYRELQ